MAFESHPDFVSKHQLSDYDEYSSTIKEILPSNIVFFYFELKTPQLKNTIERPI